MKLLLSAIGVFMATGLCAQEFQPDIDKMIAQSPWAKVKKDTAKPRFLPRAMDLNMLGLKAMQRKPGVYAMPQDGMPCIVPDTNDIAAMPNAAKAIPVPPANRMPNAAPNRRPLPPAKEWSK
jgi:hypothetical protein